MNKHFVEKKSNKQALSPRLAQRFLEWYCRPDLLEDLQGDLNEYFARNVKAKGLLRAKIIYTLDVLKFLRLYTIRKPQFINLLIHWIMINSYIKTSSRSILRHKLFSTINIVGLAISMSVGLLMIVFISDLTSYESFHTKKDRIFRIISKDHNQVEIASTSVKAGKEIQQNIPGVADVTIIRREFGGDAFLGEKVLSISGLWADNSFLKIFDFPLLQGDPGTALKEPYSIVLTESMARKLFGNENAFGKSIRLDTSHYVVTGIMKDVPKLSHLRFESLASFSTIETNSRQDEGFLDWTSVYMNHVYVLMPENGDSRSLQLNLDKLCSTENATQTIRKISLSLQPLTQISTGKTLGNQLGPKLPNLAIWILTSLAIIVIVSACFNYTNLSIARSLRRSREVGIRKVIGALKSHIRVQFISEAVLISLLALIFSFGLFLILRKQFLSLDPFVANLVSLDLSWSIIFYFIIFALVVGLLAGLLPALFFSKVNTIQVLKNISSLRVFHSISTRKALVVVQYIFSLIFITVTIMGYKQYKSFLTFDLGFKTENILNIKLQGNQAEQVIKALSERPEVTGISRSLIVMSLGSRYGGQMKYKSKDDSTSVMLNFVNEHYLHLHEHKLLAGKNFTPMPENSEENEVIVNEKTLKRFDIGGGDPAKALGEVISIDSKALTIVGVVEDFHYETVEENIEPMAFRYFHYGTNGYVNAKIVTMDWSSVMSSIETAWRKIDKVHPLEAKFYDDQIQEAYSQFSVMIKVIGFLAFLAISIASMGLFGMVVFTTETRLKEISIRKVLGASEEKLVYLLSKGFALLLSLAALIALPVTYVFFDKVVLSNFAYHEPISLADTLLGFLVIMAIAFVMVLSQTLKVARTNPAEVLKDE